MSTNTLDAALISGMFLAGAKNLESKKEWINELNVFPVPDGDTGTNMTMTILSAAKDVSGLTELNMTKLCKAMSSGSLKGARGNSGVILSQLLRGFCKGIRDYDQIDTEIAVSAFQKAVETAYKAVMKPKEGTILTVARGFYEKAAQLLEDDPQIGMEPLLEGSIAYADEVLSQTPEMLPVLKEAGVVDSGGQGLLEIFRGAFDLYCGKISLEDLAQAGAQEQSAPAGYCAEFILTPAQTFALPQEEELTAFLKDGGEDVVVLAENGIVKVHVHTQDPGPVITRAIGFGQISSVKIESLQSGHREKVVREADRRRAEELQRERQEKAQPRKEVGFVSVAVGEGLCSIFRDLGVDCLIEGGQTMNPSTEDVMHAIGQVNAETVFVFPNNKNIILAATQAQEMTKDKRVIVIPTKTIPQGISAMIGYSPEASVEENESSMREQIDLVKTCQLTYAVRDTHIEDKTIHEGDIMGVGDHGILAVGSDLEETALEALASMVDEESELISVYYGSEVSEAEAGALLEKIQEKFPNQEAELNQGSQPIYYYIISVE